MSLSWKDEQPLTPRTSFDVSGEDMKLRSDLSLSDVGEVPNNHGLPPANKFRHQENPEQFSYVPPTIRQTAEEPVCKKEKKKCWLLRPVAWLVFLLSVGLMNSIINTTFLLIDYVVKWLSTLPILAVILLTLAFGSLAIGLMFTGTLRLVVFVVSSSHAIYPSKNGVRFYIVGAVQLLISLLAIVLAIADSGTTHTFWDFAAPLYFVIMYIGMMCGVKSIID